MRRLRSHTAISTQPAVKVFDETMTGALIAGMREKQRKAACPECGSHRVHVNNMHARNGQIASQRMQCKACQHNWLIG